MARTVKSEILTKCSSENFNGRVYLEDKGVDGRLMLIVIACSVEVWGRD